MHSKRQGLGLPCRPFLFCLFLFSLATAEASNFKVELFATGLTRPVGLTAPPEDPTRVFVIEQHTGRIRVYDTQTGNLITNQFLRVTGITTGGEQGLLGLAFHPGYRTNGYFYVNYTAPGGGPGGHTEISRFQVSGDPATSNVADPATRKVLLTYNQPESNHNGGWIGFGLDGYLYIASGDGGGGNDQHGPIGNGQNRSNLLGKILRIDVDSGDPYAIPEDNPFAGHPEYSEEIWAFGLRNPWQSSIDRETGDLWIGDVGQGAREEINFNPAGVGGLNFGWRPREGDIQNPGIPSENPVTPAVDPVFAYPRTLGYTVTGGYVYRGTQIPELQGKYIFLDYGSDRIWVTTRDGENFTTEERTSDFDPSGLLQGPAAFGEDAHGELYICDLANADPGTGKIYKIVPVVLEISGAALSAGNEFQISFVATAGTEYVLESRTSLTEGEWSIATTIPPVQTDQTITINRPHEQRAEYFRLRTANP